MAFNIPAQTSLALQRPTNPQPTWTRPVDWITITDAPNEVQFLVADTYPVYGITTTFTKPASQNLYIDWGDGTTDTISTATSVTTNHTYTVGTGTPCSRGYTTFKIRIYVDSGATITFANIVRATSPVIPFNTPSGLLEVIMGDNVRITSFYYWYVSSYNINPAGTVGSTSFYMLENIKFPATYLGADFNQVAQNCYNLYKVTMPTSMPNVTRMDSAFQTCVNLQSIIYPDLPLCNRMDSFHNGCSSLRSITLPTSLPEITEASSAFSGCSSLSTILVPAMPKCTSYSSMFSGCTNLLQVKIPTWPTAISQTVTISSIFQNCRSLANIIFPNTAASGTLFVASSPFASCFALTSMVLPDYFNVASLSSMFQNLTNLQSVVLPSSMPALNQMASAFNGCTNLQNVTLPTTVSSSIAFANVFTNCNSLSKVDIPQSYNITSLATCFNGCSNLTSVTLPTGSQDNLTSMLTTFQNCSALQSVTMPSSMNGLTTMQAIFNNCFSLTSSIVFPSSLNAVTTMANAFTNTYSIKSITMPVSMSACTNFLSTFSGATNLETLTMPAVVAATATYQALFNNAFSIKSVVLPTTQTTTAPATTLNSTFNNCASLNTITNLDKVGSTSLTGTLLAGTTFATFCNVTSSLSFSSRLSKLELQGSGYNNYYSLINPVRLTNTGGTQWTGTSPQINVSYTNMSTANLNTLFADMAAQGSVSGKTINITNATGAAGLTAGDRLVITSIGWTITG